MKLLFRWSRRDLRGHALQVIAIAFIVALGAGVYSGLESTTAWQKVSYDANFSRLRMHDLRVQLAQGSFVDATSLGDAVRSIPNRRDLADVEPRLVVPQQVAVSAPHREVLTPARFVGLDISTGGPRVDAIANQGGRSMRAADSGRNVATLGAEFVGYHDLPDRGRLEVSTGARLSYVGVGTSPENFLVTDERGQFLSQGNLAVVYLPLATAQRITGHAGAANDVVIRLAPGAQVRVLERQIASALQARFPDVGVTISERRSDASYRLLYDTIRRHRRLFDVFAVLVLVAAAFVAFNFTSRLVQAQRREIGVGMALGVPPARLAIRPLLVAAQLAVLGVIFSIGVGAVMGAAMGSVLRQLTPLPHWQFPVQFGLYAQGAALGLVVPVAAALIPVWRAVGVSPIDAIRSDSTTVSRGHLPIVRRLLLPRRTGLRLPIRNLVRRPGRTAMTAVGVAVAITILVGLVGLVDSFYATADTADAEARKAGADQLYVELNAFYPTDAAPVRAITQSPLLGQVETTLQVAGSLRHQGTTFDVLLQVRDLGSRQAKLTIDDRHSVRSPGVVLTETAAHQLGVRPGEDVTVRYPRRAGLTSYQFAETPLPVIGTNPFPLRGVVYLDRQAADLARAQGLTNLLVVTPARGVSVTRVKRALFGQPDVASVQTTVALVATVREQLNRVFAALIVVEAAVFLLAVLIAYNVARITAEEETRDDATMLAFGRPVWAVVEISVLEGLVVGVLGTALGLGLGYLLLSWLVGTFLPQTIPEIGLVTRLALSTILITVALGVVAAAVAPIPNWWKLRRLNLPASLRVVE